MKGVIHMFNGLAYALLGIFGFTTIVKALAKKEDFFVTLLINVLFGGAFFVILNLCKVQLPLNLISGACIAVAGIPGVILLIVLKIVFKV